MWSLAVLEVLWQQLPHLLRLQPAALFGLLFLHQFKFAFTEFLR